MYFDCNDIPEIEDDVTDDSEVEEFYSAEGDDFIHWVMS